MSIEEKDRLIKRISQALESEDYSKTIAEYIRLGLLYQADQDTPKALTQFDQALKIAQKIDDKDSEAHLIGLVGSALKDLGNLQDASRHLKKALRLSEDIGNDLLTLDAYIHLAMVLVERGKHLEAISKLDNALILSVTIKDDLRMIKVSTLMGNIFLRLESVEKALESFSTSLIASQRIGNQIAEVEALINLGKTLMVDGGYIEAVEQFEIALDKVDMLNEPIMEIEILRGLMQANFKANKVRLAMIYGDQMINKADGSLNYQQILSLKYEYAAALSHADKLDIALNFLEEAHILAVENDDADWVYRINSTAGELCLRLEEIMKAKEFFLEAYDYAEHFQLVDDQVCLLSQLSAIAVEEGELKDSIKRTEQALEIAQTHEYKLLEGQQLVLLALSKHDLGQRDAAIKDIQQAVIIFDELKNDQLKEHAQNYLVEFSR